MLSPSQERWLSRLCRVYSAMLITYPSAFRREYGREMMIVFRTQAREVMQNESGWRLLPFMLRLTSDWIKTTFQESTSMARLTHTLRWFAALPAAILAGAAALRAIGFLTPMYVDLFNGFHLVWVWMGLGLFLMAAAFVTVGVWLAPNRRSSVGRIALTVVGIGGGLLVILGAVTGAMTPLLWGICTLLGGVVGYLPWRSRQPSPA